MHVFEVMAEPIRRRIVDVLTSGEHTAGTIEELICREFGVGRSAVQHHLAVFKTNGWVDIRHEEAERWYRLEPDAVRDLEKAAHRIRKAWGRRYGSIDRQGPPIPQSKKRMVAHSTRRGYRGHGKDPDDPWSIQRNDPTFHKPIDNAE